ncbi:FAD-binding oxidoreductase [Pseudonocardia yuanmonensis]|uniref:FAD-binding oxidoreductase n=1 Tax=Pseudonocardia yuanmonensis TaxID=1095914 RepID=A0ABP8XL20_9PSEU
MTRTDALTGTVLWPGDAGYDRARTVFNGMIDRRPAAIVRCREPGDVARGVLHAREHGLALSVRGGGHNVAGTAVCEGGLMLDLSPMRSVEVDPAARRARARGGALLGDLDGATRAFGLATPLGVMSGTGIAGLTLGGGLGWLAGKYGLSCDNLIDAEMVTADGTVFEGVDDDLLWGLRGGGGNFGVVTTFTYRLHPVDTVTAGALGFPWEAAGEVLRAHDDLVAGAPDELATAVSLARGPSGRPVLTIALCWCGAPEAAGPVLRPLRRLRPDLDTVAEQPFADWQRVPDAGYPPGRRHYWRSAYLRHLTDAAIGTLLQVAEAMPPGDSGIGLQGLRGAAARVAPRATAFPHRAPQYDFLVLAQWPDPADTPRNIAWARAASEAMRPHLEAGVYVNNLGSEGPDRVRAAYGDNHARLVGLKRRLDPDNVFRANQNVVP